MAPLVRRYWAYRLLTAAVVLLGIPTVLSVPSFLDEAPIRTGEESPRTVVAPSLIRVEDPEATERARREARQSVREIVEFDPQALTAVVNAVRDNFAAVREVRQPAGPGDAAPTIQEQIDALEQRLPMLSDEGLRILVTASSNELQTVSQETVDIAQQLARQRIREDEVQQVLDEQLSVELAVRDIPPDTAQQVVEPIIRSAMQATVVVDEEATRAAREQAAEDVADVQRTFTQGSVIVSAGDEVSPVQMEALNRAGLAGSEPRRELLAAIAAVLALVLVVSLYLRTHQRRIWRSNRRLLLFAVLGFGYAIILGAMALAIDRNPVWFYGLPAGAFGMLATILLGPSVGVLAAVPATLLTAVVAPDSPGVIAFVAAATLVSVPFGSGLSARGDLRRGTVMSGLATFALAGLFAAVFGDLDQVPRALVAGLGSAAGSAFIVLGGLPFIESAFGIVTATSLIDLADRNHPLMRELEQKALGSYNHSILVSTLVDRACRSIGADPLLGSVLALYHDIGKVQRPYFFVENQFGIPNPHEDLEPEVSALIIQEHVTDGVEMARSVRLPPEVIEGIATHHGTTLVTFFYLEAVRRADPDESIDEGAFRYPGRKPSTKETAVLMLADCCEAASRAAAQNDRNLTRVQLEDLVEALLADRVDDGQLDESPLTFQDLATVKASFIETLVGVYHPRIAYPDRESIDEEREGRRDEPSPNGTGPDGSVPDLPSRKDHEPEGGPAPSPRLAPGRARRS